MKLKNKNHGSVNMLRLILAGLLLAVFAGVDPVRADAVIDLVVEKSHVGNFSQGSLNQEYYITVTNQGEVDTDGSTVTVIDVLPEDMEAVSISGTGWNCDQDNLICTRDEVLPASQSFPVITLVVNVFEWAPTSVTNTVTVNGGGEGVTETANNMYEDETTILKPDVLITGYQLLDEFDDPLVGYPEVGQQIKVKFFVQNQGTADTAPFYRSVFYKSNFDLLQISPPGHELDLDNYPEGCLYETEPTEPEIGDYYPPVLFGGISAGANDNGAVVVTIDDPPLPAGINRLYLYADPTCLITESNENNNVFGPITISVGGGVFVDVPPGAFAWQQIESIYFAGITGGCSTNPLNYCPNGTVTRAQMAVFLLRGIHGSTYTPPAATGTEFTDVPVNSFAAAWIEQLVAEGVTSGCGGGKYCPTGLVTRAQMAVFLLRAKHGSGYTPPAATGTDFTDVPANSFAAAWIEQLVAEGITSGCGGGKYCPNNAVSRAQMAVFLKRTFNLP